MNKKQFKNTEKNRRKWIFPLMAFLLIFSSTGLMAQQTKISLSVEKVSLRQLFAAIESQSDYKFLYRDVILDDKKDISVKADGREVTFILDQVLPARDLQYKIVGKNINIIRKSTTVATVNKLSVLGSVV